MPPIKNWMIWKSSAKKCLDEVTLGRNSQKLKSETCLK